MLIVLPDEQRAGCRACAGRLTATRGPAASAARPQRGPRPPAQPSAGAGAPGERLLQAPADPAGRRERSTGQDGARRLPPRSLPSFPPSFSRPHRTQAATCRDLRLSAAAGDGRRPRLRAEGGSSGAGRRRARRGLCGRQRGARGLGRRQRPCTEPPGPWIPQGEPLLPAPFPASLPLTLPPCPLPCLPSCLLHAPESSHSSLLQARHVFLRKIACSCHIPPRAEGRLRFQLEGKL